MLAKIKLWFKNLVELILQFFLGKGLKSMSIYAAFVVFIIGMYSAFVAATYLAVIALKPALPAQAAYAFVLFPPSTPLYVGAYYTALLSKRVFDWHMLILLERQRAAWNSAF